MDTAKKIDIARVDGDLDENQDIPVLRDYRVTEVFRPRPGVVLVHSVSMEMDDCKIF